MTHFAVISPFFPSHVRALEALACELIGLGHRVSWIAPHDVRAMLRDRRIDFLEIGQRTHPAGSLASVLARAARPGGPLGLRRVIRDMCAATRMLCDEAPAAFAELGIEAVIADPMEAAGGLLAEACGLPFVSVSCALPLNREARVPLPVMPWGLALDDASIHRNEISTRIYDWMMRPHARTVAAQARRLGVAPRAGRLDDFLSPLLQLSQTTPGFDFPREHLPACFHHVGPLRPTEDDGPLRWALRMDRPFVFASLGTLQGGRLGLFRRIAQACQALEVQLLIAHCGGLNDAQCRKLLDDGATWVTDFAPQRAVIQAADAVITHAGLNTVMDALAAGTPMLALPIAFDQPGAAARVAHAGAGLRRIPALSTSRLLQQALHEVLSEPAFAERAARLGQEIEQCGGAPRAARLIDSALADAGMPDGDAPTKQEAALA